MNPEPPPERTTAPGATAPGATAPGATAPGRICLFGEHQDYLGLPVIAAAIDLRMFLRVLGPHPDGFHIQLKDLSREVSLPLTTRHLAYHHKRDYFRSVINVLLDEGVRWKSGFRCQLESNIPIRAGTSSSSAMVLCWLRLLLLAAEDPRAYDAAALARLAYRAEVEEFGEPGGMMDHFACALGKLIYLETKSGAYRQLESRLGTFVLGDSGQPKDTKGVLQTVKTAANQAIGQIKKRLPGFELSCTPFEKVKPHLHQLEPYQAQVLEANLIDRDLSLRALEVLTQPELDHVAFGQLLTRHHNQLAHKKRISTPKINQMLEAALDGGALGGKINGSGGGGCMFAYAPDHPQKVARAIESAGGRAFIIRIGNGVG